MSNDSINPEQQFFDFAGRDNINGTIEFFTDPGKLTQKAIFSDSALTVAQSNPYTLDDSGRIIGDVHYDGTATLVHKDRNGYEFRQDDGVTVTSAGDSSSLTIQEESVGTMVANQALIIGNLVRTRGYYTGTVHGGARYLIVPPGTGVVDNYRFILLGNGLRAQLLDLEQNNNYLVAGAKGDGGTNDGPAMQAVINQGGDIVVEGGFTFVADTLLIPLNVRFVGGGAMKQRNGASGDFLQITDRAVSLVKFRGVILDGNQPNVDPNNATVGWVIGG